MRRKVIRKIAGVILATLMLLTLIIPSVMIINTAANAIYDNMPPLESHWAAQEMTNCAQLNLLTEHGGAWFDEPVTPEQLYELLETAMTIKIPYRTSQRIITRAEMANILASILEPNNKTDSAFTICERHGILKNYPDGSQNPDEIATNAQACVVTIRMVKHTMEYTPTMPETDRTLYNGKPITYENITAGLLEIKSAYPTGTLWINEPISETSYYPEGPNPTDASRDIGKLNANLIQYLGVYTMPANLRYGAGGFACMVSEYLLGPTGFPAREVEDTKNVAPGDIVYFTNNQGEVIHVAIVYKLYRINHEIYFQTAGGEENGIVRFSDDVEKNFHRAGIGCRVFTRYPESPQKPFS